MEDLVYSKAHVIQMCEDWKSSTALAKKQMATNDWDGVEGNQEVAACIQGDLVEALACYRNIGYDFNSVNEMYKNFNGKILK